MGGTTILTGANGSLGIYAAERLLKAHDEFTFVFTTRNAARSDPNTQNLRYVISGYPNAKY
jgi:NAD(P)-dependent dehydrogenase (short-subunit alcohol dehydrogenase family)